MADDDDITRSFEPISNLTPARLGRGMWNRARTQGEGIARQIAQNYQDLGDFARDAVSPIVPRESSGVAPWEQRPAEMTEAPFAQRSSDPGVRLGAELFDPANFVLGGGAAGAKLGSRALSQAAAARALRETAPVVERELPRLPWNSQAGFMTPKSAGAIAGGGLGLYGLSRVLRGDKTEQPDDPAARTTANAFRQQQEAMDAVNEELKRQNRAK